MNKKALLGGIVALVVIGGLAAGIISYDWGMGDGPTPIPFGLDENGKLPWGGLNYQLFEVWGPALLALGTLMFGAIIAGVCISKDEEKKKEGQE